MPNSDARVDALGCIRVQDSDMSDSDARLGICLKSDWELRTRSEDTKLRSPSWMPDVMVLRTADCQALLGASGYGWRGYAEDEGQLKTTAAQAVVRAGGVCTG